MLSPGRNRQDRRDGGLLVRPRSSPGAILNPMRITPVVGRKAWFGPRRLGWGLEPVSREGWIVTLIFATVALLAHRTNLSSRPVKYAVGGAFFLVRLVKGAAPGGAGARADFDAARAAALDA